MKVLSVASEMHPLVKTGGLADVAGALPRALRRQGVEMRPLVPGYPVVLGALESSRTVHGWDDLLGETAELVEGRSPAGPVYVLVAPALFERPGGLYTDAAGKDWPDNWLRFAALSRAAADIAGGVLPSFQPDVVHAHDWQAGLVPVFMHYDGVPVPCVITVHNIAFQGQFGAEVFKGLRLPADAFGIDGVEYYGDVGFLKGGLLKADAITTVSPTYAHEIRRPEFGMGLDGLIRSRSDSLHGLVNGIDTAVWNPQTDRDLAMRYDIDTLELRAANRQAIEARLGLDPDEGPLLCVVSRLTWQKGLDVLAEAVDALVAAGLRLAVLGSGERPIEDALIAASTRYPGRVAIATGYDEPLSHLLQGGADAILVPSRFEPCGLTQLYGLRYGCVPVVARTGGLADTIIEANDAALAAGVATGFMLPDVSADGLLRTLRRLADTHADRAAWRTIQRNGMRTDVSWSASAGRYARLYRALIEKAAA